MTTTACCAHCPPHIDDKPIKTGGQWPPVTIDRASLSTNRSTIPRRRKKAGNAMRFLLFQSVKKPIFDRLAEVKEAPKTSNSTPKCMWILERGELRSKSKSLAQQAFLQSLSQLPDIGNCQLPLHKGAGFGIHKLCVLTVWGFFDTLKKQETQCVSCFLLYLTYSITTRRLGSVPTE